MRHTINRCKLNLKTLADEELESLLAFTAVRQEHLDEERDLLRRERERRGRPIRLVHSASSRTRRGGPSAYLLDLYKPDATECAGTRTP